MKQISETQGDRNNETPNKMFDVFVIVAHVLFVLMFAALLFMAYLISKHGI